MRRLSTCYMVSITMLGWAVAISQADQVGAPAAASQPANVAETARAAAKSGELCFRLTTPAELKALLGPPAKAHEENDGNGKALILEYPGVRAIFGRFGEGGPYCLFRVLVENVPLDIGMERTLTLRRVDDLAKLDAFSGVANISLVKLDLREQLAKLSRLPFDNQTQWPPNDKMPKGFEPAKLLQDGTNPGLGVRKLHEQGIDGRGVNIAIIDQPLLRDHREYKDRVVAYEAIDAEGVPPQMHGSPVTSIAVGKTCGIAPAASVHYYAAPMWKWWNEHCKPYSALLDRIVERNRDLPAGQKVRVVSISLGAFSEWPDHELWAKAVKHAAAEGILVVSCDSADLRIAILKRNLAKDPDTPESYARQLFFGPRDALGVPAGNRATAYFAGSDDYIFWRDGGMSWTVPYLAGLAALAYQVDPDLKPQAVPDLWTKTASRTAAGLVVNPTAFIAAVRKTAAAAKTAK